MTTWTRRTFLTLLATTAAARAALAASYPTRPVVIVVPYPPGGQPDVIARVVADRLSHVYPQRFVVENRVGGLGNTGSVSVARATPDGHTLMVGTVASHGVNPNLIPNIPYDAVKDFRAVALLAQAPGVLVVNSKLPVNTFKEFIAYVQANPGKISFASPGAGTLNYLIMEMIKKNFSLNLPAVPYRGAGPAFNDVTAGHVESVVTNIELAAPAIGDGRIKALAVSSEKRSNLLPDVPTYAELGYPQFTSTVWSGMFAPAGTPDEIVNDLNKRAREVLREPDTVALMAKFGIVGGNTTPEEFSTFVKAEIKRLGEQIRETGITLEQ